MDKNQDKDKKEKKVLGRLAECLEGSLADSLQERPVGGLKVEPWELIFPVFPLGIHEAQWLASGIRDYLSGKHNSLDKALDLTNQVGRPRDPTKEDLIATLFLEAPGELTNEALIKALETTHKDVFAAGSIDPKQIRRAKKSGSITKAYAVKLNRQMNEKKGGQN